MKDETKTNTLSPERLNQLKLVEVLLRETMRPKAVAEIYYVLRRDADKSGEAESADVIALMESVAKAGIALLGTKDWQDTVDGVEDDIKRSLTHVVKLETLFNMIDQMFDPNQRLAQEMMANS
jgi:hypothetical protein